MKNLCRILLLVFIHVSAHGAGWKREIFEKQILYRSESLVLRGQAVKQSKWLRLKKSATGLYLPPRIENPLEIFNDFSVCLIEIAFFTDFKAEEVYQPWLDQMQERAQKALFNRLASLPEVKDGDRMLLVFSKNSVSIYVDGLHHLTLGGTASWRLLDTLVGDNAYDPQQKKQLLGVSKF